MSKTDFNYNNMARSFLRVHIWAGISFPLDPAQRTAIMLSKDDTIGK